MNKQNRYFRILFLLVIISVINGCTSDTEYISPSKVESIHVTGEAPSETQIQAESQKSQTFKIGDTATDKELKVTLNNVKFVSKIDEVNNEFLVSEAPPGKQYAIIDITIENILPDKTQIISTLTETSITDQDGYSYIIDAGTLSLEKSFKDGEILPGMKKRGELAYLVPINAKDLKFIYKFDLFVGTTAVFGIN